MDFESFHYMTDNDKITEDIIKNKIIYFNLFPNMYTVRQLKQINSDFIEDNLDYFRLLIIPVYKYNSL